MNPIAQEACTEMSDSGDTKSAGQGQTQRTRHSLTKSRLPRGCQRCYGGSQALSAEVRSLACQLGWGWEGGWGGGGDCLAKNRHQVQHHGQQCSPALRTVCASFLLWPHHLGQLQKGTSESGESPTSQGATATPKSPSPERVGLSGSLALPLLTLWPDTKVGAQLSCFPPEPVTQVGCPCHGRNRTQPRVTCAEASRCQ